MSAAKKQKVKETVVPLSEPIEHGQETITELRIRRPKAKHMRGFPMEGAEFGDVLNLLSRLCGQPTSVIDELDAEDLTKVCEVVENFIPGGRATGKKRSRS